MELHTLLWSVVSSLSVHTLLVVPLISRASVVQIEIRTDCLINMKEDIQTHNQHQDLSRLQYVYVILDADLYLTLSGAPLQTDHILISDIGLSDNTALTCWNSMTQPTIFTWYHRHKEVNKIYRNGNRMGWQSKLVTSGGRHRLILTRMFGASAKEGTLTCISSSREYAISVEVHYLSE